MLIVFQAGTGVATNSPVGTWDWSWGTSKHVTFDIRSDGTWEQYDELGLWNRGVWQQEGNSTVLSQETCDRGGECMGFRAHNVAYEDDR